MKPQLMYLFSAFALAWVILFAYLGHLNRTQKRLEAEMNLLRQVSAPGRE